jgi:hypothetical protein
MSEESTGRTRAQHVTVVDAVRSGHHGVDQGQHLAPGYRVIGHATKVDQLIGQLEGTQLLGQRGHHRQPRPGDPSVVVKCHPKARRSVKAIQGV